MSVSLAQASLLDIFEVLRSKRFVDMTHTFSEGIPHWPGFPEQKAELIYHYDEGVGTMGSGFCAHYYGHVGQWGTHVDPPCHFVKGGRTLDELDVKEMICPLAVLDVHEKAAANPDYAGAPEDLYDWEKRHGRLPEGAFVVLRTDWFKRWPDPAAIANADAEGIPHFPGWGMELLKILCEERKVRAIGHETTDTDPGCTGSLPGEYYVLDQDIYQVELLANTDQLPEWGALVVASWPKPLKGSGFPARVFAILP
ncbi:MAG: cyclase family protein [Fretibacterium sp.]|nr:cyclase family protein [Fretibacterium sp.]